MNKKYIALAVLPIVVVLFFVAKKAGIPQPDSFQPSEMRAAQYSSKEVIGDLGGVPVKIPKHFANYVEYDGDPGFGEKRQVDKPVRTYQSKIFSFGFDVRYPDMVGESTPQLREERRKRNIFTTTWISVGISSSSRYYGNESLDRLARATVDTPNEILKYRNYEKLPDEQYGLTVYAASGVDPKTNKPYRQDDDAKDVFIYRNANGNVITYIDCSNRQIESARCEQTVSLEPFMKAEADIHYRRGLLSEWQKIQESVTQLIYSFKVPAAEQK